MKMQKYPLRDRLLGLSKGEHAHPEYIYALLRNFSQMTITDYLADFPEDLTHLAELVQYPEDYMNELTYSDIAARVQQMHQYGMDGEALEILAKPFTALYQLHLERSGFNG